MSEEGVNIINGYNLHTQLHNISRSSTPIKRTISGGGKEEEKHKRFLNGWSKEQEQLMADWSDIALCYRWLHDQSEKVFHTKTLWINLPVIILSTLGGTANFGVQSLFSGDDTALKYSSFVIGGVSLVAGLLTTVGNYLRYAQLEESHRVASIAWGKFQRLVAVELALNPNDRMDSLDFLKICRADLDRLIEQSPPISQYAIEIFENKFGKIKDLKKPDICGALEHTPVYQSSETRLKQMATEAALMLRRKRQMLTELVSPVIEKQIATQVEERITEAIETRKKTLEDEIEARKMEEHRIEEERHQALEERRKKIEEELELERKKIAEIMPPISPNTAIIDSGIILTPRVVSGSQFEDRLKYRRTSINTSSPPQKKRSHHIKSDLSNIIVETENNEKIKSENDTIVIVNKS